MTKISCHLWLVVLLLVSSISSNLGANATFQEQRRQEVDTGDGTTTFVKAGHPDPSPSSTLTCLPAPSGAFGGVAGCIPIPTSTADGLVDGTPSFTEVESIPTTTTTTPLGFLPPPPPVTTATPAEPADITTYTTLPPGASFITLPSGQFTSPQFITTTLPGSSSETVVPVIVPTGSGGGGGGGPPVICAGCPFPAAIIIPPIEGGGGGGGGGSGFCFQLFSLKIGSCPQDDNDNSGGDDDGSKPTDTPKTDKPSETTGETPTSTEQASACTISVTATFESVFCTVTATYEAESNGKKAKREAAATGCSTQVYSTVTACGEAAGATTTVTTTLQPITPFLCSEENCGSCGDTASDSSRLLRGRRDDISLSLLTKRAAPGRREPAPGKVATPDDYSGPDPQGSFMRGETYQISAAKKKDGLVRLKVPNGPLATSKFILWKDVPAAIGLVGLYGCTAIVVASQKGAWIGHFWEKPHFTLDDRTFEVNVLDQIIKGRSPADVNHIFGLAQLRSPSPAKLGDDLVGDVFDDIYSPQVFMMVPRKRVLDPSVPQALRTSSTAGSDLGPEFVERTQRIAETIRTIFNNPSLDIKQVDYSPVAFTDKDIEDAIRNGGPTKETMNRMEDTEWLNARGKLLVQFEPKAVNDCNDRNKVRVFFEDHPLNTQWPSWMTVPGAPPNIVSPPNGEFSWLRRSLDARDEGDTCELNPTSATPATTEAVSSTTESTPAGTATAPACESVPDGSFGGVEGCVPIPTASSQSASEPTSTTHSEPSGSQETTIEISCLPQASGAFGGIAGCIPGPTITQPPAEPTMTSIPPAETRASRSPPTCLGEAYSSNVGFERDNGVKWAEDFCKSQYNAPGSLRELNPQNPKLYQNLDELKEGSWYVHLSAEEGVGGVFCQEGEVLSDIFDVEKCVSTFKAAIDSCAPFKWVEKDKPFVKYSAWILANCYNWTIELRQDDGSLGIGKRNVVELY